MVRTYSRLAERVYGAAVQNGKAAVGLQVGNGPRASRHAAG